MFYADVRWCYCDCDVAQPGPAASACMGPMQFQKISCLQGGPVRGSLEFNAVGWVTVLKFWITAPLNLYFVSGVRWDSGMSWGPRVFMIPPSATSHSRGRVLSHAFLCYHPALRQRPRYRRMRNGIWLWVVPGCLWKPVLFHEYLQALGRTILSNKLEKIP